MATFTVEVRLNLVGCHEENEFDVDDADLDGLTEDEKTALIENEAREAMFEMIEWNWKKANE